MANATEFNSRERSNPLCITIITAERTLVASLQSELEMWANTKRDARPAEYRWRPLFNAAKFV